MTVDIATARSVLRDNDRGGYTVPTARLYPFQWNWDSAFVAMGWATFDEARAWEEIRSLLRGQWDDGLIPQIVFHAPSDDYFPGPEVWGTEHVPPTSGIPQPPVLATAARRVLDAASDRAMAEAQMAEIYPRLLRNHRWWRRARDPEGTGLVATLHPWESGMDNSPCWDEALARVPTETETPVRRRDTGHVDASMRPRQEEYQRFIHLVDVFRGAGWDAARMLAASPFRMTDLCTNSVLLRAEHDLLILAARFGTVQERTEIGGRVTAMAAALGKLWDDELGLFTAWDQIGAAPVRVGVSAGFLPLFAGAADRVQAQALAATLARWGEQVSWLVPSCDPGNPAFDARRYWRGPVWAVVNWMIAEGFAEAGDAASAGRIRGLTRALIERAGFAEYFDPVTGAAAGGGTFSWTAAMFLLLVG